VNVKIKGWKIPATVAASVLALGGGLAITASAESAPPARPATATPTAAPGWSNPHQAKPTIVLISGAFEDSSNWDAVMTRLQRDGYQVIAAATPMRGLATDAAYVSAIVHNIKGPVVLAGHSLGGMTATQVAALNPTQVKSVVYAAAFIPQKGEAAGQLLGQFPGSLLGPDTTYTVSYPGGTDMYVKPSSYRALFAADRTSAQAAVGAAAQRPVNAAELAEPAAASLPTTIPAYAIVANQDKGIPAAAEKWEAQRAHAHITTLNSAHDVTASHPYEVAGTIEHAAR
jgi:pimeloyl-ACP methyl ester carboxylesterase